LWLQLMVNKLRVSSINAVRINLGFMPQYNDSFKSFCFFILRDNA